MTETKQTFTACRRPVWVRDCMQSAALSHTCTLALLRALMSCRHLCLWVAALSGDGGKTSRQTQSKIPNNKQQIISPLSHIRRFPSKKRLALRIQIFISHFPLSISHLKHSSKLEFCALLPSTREASRAQRALLPCCLLIYYKKTMFTSLLAAQQHQHNCVHHTLSEKLS